MDFNKAMKLYFDCKREVELIEAEAASKAANAKEKIKTLMQWMELKAREEGLKNVPVEGIGTGFWKTVTSAKVANRTEFRDFCQKNELWDLMEIRAASTEVKRYIDKHNAPPNGVTFGQTSIFQIRSASEKAKDDE